MSSFVFLVVSAPGAFYALEQSTLVGKIVLALLLVLSIISWSIMITKFRQVMRARATSEEFLARLRREKDLLAPFSQRLALRDCPLWEIYAAGCRELQTCGNSGASDGGVATARLTALEIAHIEAALERTVSEQAILLESQITLLGTAVSAAPFTGLLGTVWGIMDAFAGIATKGNTTIAAVGPGIAAALIATVGGLAVAIPSMIGYNVLVHRIRALTVMMDNFASEFMTMVRREAARGES